MLPEFTSYRQLLESLSDKEIAELPHEKLQSLVLQVKNEITDSLQGIRGSEETSIHAESRRSRLYRSLLSRPPQEVSPKDFLLRLSLPERQALKTLLRDIFFDHDHGIYR